MIWIGLNPKDIPPDDLGDVILNRMIEEAGMFYKMELGGNYLSICFRPKADIKQKKFKDKRERPTTLGANQPF